MEEKEASRKIHYPRRRVIRSVLRGVVHVLFDTLTELEVIGREHMPSSGPLLLAANHFSFIDPALVVRVTPWPIEVLGGFRTPNGPQWGPRILRLWGYFPVHRGTGARAALRAVESVLAQGGVVGIAPEGGSWATVLRPARPGVAFLAARSGARVLPLGIDGAHEVFASLRQHRRAHVTARFGKPFGPFQVTERGRDARRRLDEIGDEIMRRIAELIPPERRGYYSDDPAIRAAARGTEVYPWDGEEEV